MFRRSSIAVLWVALSCASDDRSSEPEPPPEGAAGAESTGGSGDGSGGEPGSAGREPPSSSAGAEQCEVEPSELYRQRIEPLLTDEQPKTCNQCHLSGVDLSMFARDTPCETMACLVDEGLVDLEDPVRSKILGWIERATPDSELITESVIQAEYDGFLEWIEANAACTTACAGVSCEPPETPATCEVTKPPTGGPVETPGCSDAALEQVFYDNVYASRGRCSPCHFSNQPNADAAAPRWIKAEGNCASASLETMRRVIAGGYLNLEDPTQSLLLLKPLAESAGGVPHGGHDKFASTEEAAYVGFLHFIERYAECNAPE